MEISEIRVLVKGVVAIYYLGGLLAIVGNNGAIVWRDENYPIYLIEHLILNPLPEYRWN